MIYLLGGPPKVGKSIISAEIRRRFALSVVSTDALAAVMEDTLRPDTAPDLFVFDGFYEMPMRERLNLLVTNPEKVIDYVNRESRVVWAAVESYISRENEEGRNALVEGVAVLPELVGRIHSIPHQVVFVGNRGDDHEENIRKSAEGNSHDWMRGASAEYIIAFAAFVNRMSEYIELEAEKNGFKYIELENERFELVIEKVIESLGICEIE